MNVDFRPIVIQCRFYESGGYQKRSPYCDSCVIQIIDDVAFLSGLKSHIDMKIVNQIIEYLHSLGVKRMEYDVKKRRVSHDIDYLIGLTKKAV